MNEILDVIGSRLKSTYFGYVSLSFIGINWRELFFLLFADSSVLDRVAHFDLNTDLFSLLFFPLGIAAILTFLTPWTKFIFGYISQKPVSMYGTLLAKTENNAIIERTEHENARNLYFSAKEQDVLDQVKRDEQLVTIQDPRTRVETELKLAKIRVEKDGLSSKPNIDTMTNEQKGNQRNLAQALTHMSEFLMERGELAEAEKFNEQANDIQRFLTDRY